LNQKNNRKLSNQADKNIYSASSASKRKLEIGKLHVTQSLDYIERQAYAHEDFQVTKSFVY